jgi:hypothetical protein
MRAQLASGSVDRQVRRHFHTLAFVWRDHLDRGREPRMGSRINGSEFDLGTCGILSKEVVASPVLRRPDWPGNKPAPAVWAHVLQDRIDTRGAKRAFVSTNACFKGLWRQCLVAVLAGRPQFKHVESSTVAADVALNRAFQRVRCKKSMASPLLRPVRNNSEQLLPLRMRTLCWRHVAGRRHHSNASSH